MNLCYPAKHPPRPLEAIARIAALDLSRIDVSVISPLVRPFPCGPLLRIENQLTGQCNAFIAEDGAVDSSLMVQGYKLSPDKQGRVIRQDQHEMFPRSNELLRISPVSVRSVRIMPSEYGPCVGVGIPALNPTGGFNWGHHFHLTRHQRSFWKPVSPGCHATVFGCVPGWLPHGIYNPMVGLHQLLPEEISNAPSIFPLPVHIVRLTMESSLPGLPGGFGSPLACPTAGIWPHVGRHEARNSPLLPRPESEAGGRGLFILANLFVEQLDHAQSRAGWDDATLILTLPARP